MPKEIEVALEQASDNDLLNEVFRRGLIARPAPGSGNEAATGREISLLEVVQIVESHERWRQRRGRHETGAIDGAIASPSASLLKHYEYIGQLFDLLRRKRLDKMRERCIWRTDTTPEFADLGMRLTKTLFDHLVVAWRGELDAGICDVELLWEYLMSTSGHQFASDLVEVDSDMPPNLWASFIYLMIQDAASSFLDIVDDEEEPADQNSENGHKAPDFIN